MTEKPINTSSILWPQSLQLGIAPIRTGQCSSASKRQFDQKITDLYATAVVRCKQPDHQVFFAMVLCPFFVAALRNISFVDYKYPTYLRHLSSKCSYPGIVRSAGWRGVAYFGSISVVLVQRRMIIKVLSANADSTFIRLVCDYR